MDFAYNARCIAIKYKSQGVLEVATDTQISPDGSRIAYSRSSNDIMTDRSVSNIWIVDANGENHRPLLSGA